MIRRQFLIDEVPCFIQKFKNKQILVNELNEFEYIEQTNESNSFFRLEHNRIIGCNLSNHKVRKLTKKCQIIIKTRYYIPLTANLDAIIDFKNDIPSDIFVDFNNEKEANEFIIPDWFGVEIIHNLNNKTKRKSK